MIWLRIGIFFGVTSAAGLAGYYQGADSVQRKWDEVNAAQVLEQLDAVEINSRTLRMLQETKNANLKIVSALRRDLDAIRVRLPETACIGTDATSGSQDEPAGTGSVPIAPQSALDEFVGGVASDYSEVDEMIEHCRVLRDFAASIQ